MLKAKIKITILILIGLLAINGFVIAADTKLINPKIKNSQPYSEAVIDLTNTHRKSLGLSDLTINPRLNQAAVNKANDMLKRGYFSHTSPDGQKFSQWIKDIDYEYFYVGENLAIDFDEPQEAFDAWLKSEKHRQNIERTEFQEIGVASLKGKFQNHETWVIVQLFGTRVLGENELSLGSNSYSLAGNYFYEADKTNWSAFNYTLNFLCLFLLAYIFYLFKQNKKLPQSAEAQHFDMLYFTAQSAKLKTPWPERFDNTQKYLKSENLNTSARTSKQNNRLPKMPTTRITIEANQLHCRKN